MSRLSRVVIPLVALVMFHLFCVSLCGEAKLKFQKDKIIIRSLVDSPNSLVFRCQEKGWDLGYQSLSTGQEFSWTFKPKLFVQSVFFCHFYWTNDKDIIFDVFNSDVEDNHCAESPDYVFHKLCVWEVRPDGFFVGSGDGSWSKLHDWP